MSWHPILEALPVLRPIQTLSRSTPCVYTLVNGKLFAVYVVQANLTGEDK